jgi:hypothetical protein
VQGKGKGKGKQTAPTAAYEHLLNRQGAKIAKDGLS